jgi:hypothetical protein
MRRTPAPTLRVLVCAVLATAAVARPAASDSTTAAAPARGEKLYLRAATPGPVTATVMQPFTVELVAERGEIATRLSVVAFTLVVPDGLVLVGEELLVDSLLGLGSSRDGINLVFECSDKTPLPILRFRFVATRPVAGAAIQLEPERKTNFLGIVACRDQDFMKFDTTPDRVLVDAR